MRMVRHVTLVTANVGRGATVQEFKDNVLRIQSSVPKKGVFIGWQEVDEADVPNEMDFIKKTFGPTHRFAGTKTHTPIAIPRNFEISRGAVLKGSDGQAGLQPDRQIVQATVFPEGHPDRKAIATNTHLGRNVPELQDERKIQTKRLRNALDNDLLTWLTADLNEPNFEQLGFTEKRLVTTRNDYIRAYEAVQLPRTRIRLISTKTIPLVGDGHNAHVAHCHIIWP